MREKTSYRLWREQADDAWRWLVFLWGRCFQDLYRWRPEKTKNHFRMEIQEPHRRFRERERKRNPRADWNRKPTRKEKSELREAAKFHTAFQKILIAAAKNKKPSPDDFQVWKKALNRKIVSLDDAWRLGASSRNCLPGAYIDDLRAVKDDYRAIADSLLRYLSMRRRAGLVHTLCQICGGIMGTGRGGKRVCSPGCRNQKWNYSARKDSRKRYREKKESERREQAMSRRCPSKQEYAAV